MPKFAACLPYSYDAPIVGEYPAQYYFDMPRGEPLARVIVISPDIQFADGRSPHYAPGSDELRWLAEAVTSARAKYIPYVIVAMHKPCLTTEDKPCESGEQLANMLIEKKVDLVLMGHVHAYERTFPLTCIKAGQEGPGCVVHKRSDYLQTAGTTFITVGTGGRKLRELHDNDPEEAYFAKRFGAKQGRYGIGKLAIDDTHMTHQFIDASSGQVLDEVTILRR